MRICDVFCYFVPLVSFKNVKSTRGGVLLLITLLKIMLFFNDVNGPKLRKTLHFMFVTKNVYECVFGVLW